MDAPTCPWVSADDTAPWGLTPVPYTVTASLGFCSPGLSSPVFCVTGGVSSSPALSSSSPGNAAPAIQAVITLNLTSSQNLTYLLGGLLDNNTQVRDMNAPYGFADGVNGYFLPVTSQLNTLGLSQVVLNTLANTSAMSGGVGGAPYSIVLIPRAFHTGGLHPGNAYPLDLFSFFAGIWNSFAGDFATLLLHLEQDVVGLVGIVWNAVVAATVYFGHIVQGVAHLAAYAADWVVKTTVTGLEVVGGALEAALQALMAFIKAAIIKLLTPVFSPIINAMDQYEASLSTDLRNAQNDLNTGKSITQDAAQFWSDFSGPVFYFAIGVGIVVTVVVTVVEGLSLGAAFLLPIIIGLVMGTVAAAVADKGGPSYLKDFQGVNPISSALAKEWESILGGPGPFALVRGSLSPATRSSSNSLLDAAAGILSVGTTSWAATYVVDAWEFGVGPGVWDAAAVTCGIIGLILAGVSYSIASTLGSVVSILFDGMSLGIDYLAIEGKPGVEDVAIWAMDLSTTGLDFVNGI